MENLSICDCKGKYTFTKIDEEPLRYIIQMILLLKLLAEKRVRLRFQFRNVSRAVILSFVWLEKNKCNYSSIFEIKFNIYLNNDKKNVDF